MGGVANSDLFGTDNPLSAYPIMQTATAQAPGRDSESTVIKKHERLIRYIAIPFASGGVSLDDLMQEGKIALLGAARTYDPSLGIALWTYARKFVLGAMFRFRTKEVGEPCRLSILPSGDSTDDGMQVVAESLESEAATPDDALETAELVAIAAREFSFLDETQRRVLRMRFGDELDVRSIATKLDLSKSDVDRIYHGAIAKLRERVGARL